MPLSLFYLRQFVIQAIPTLGQELKKILTLDPFQGSAIETLGKGLSYPLLWTLNECLNQFL